MVGERSIKCPGCSTNSGTAGVSCCRDRLSWRPLGPPPLELRRRRCLAVPVRRFLCCRSRAFRSCAKRHPQVRRPQKRQAPRLRVRLPHWIRSFVRRRCWVCPPIGPGVITLEAETISEGNAVGDKTLFGLGIGVLTTPKVPAFASYQLNIPKSDDYEIFARYAAEGARPVSLLLNGKIANKQFCGNPTGGYYPAAQRWFSGGVFNLPAGKNTVRLESNGPFPHIDKIAFAPMGSPK